MWKIIPAPLKRISDPFMGCEVEKCFFEVL
jgi:hypothetical protein